MQLKTELQNFKKEGDSVTEYMSKIKGMFDSLVFVECPLEEEDQMMHYLGGLGQDYDAAIVNMLARISQSKILVKFEIPKY